MDLERQNAMLREALRKIRDQNGASLRVRLRPEDGIATNDDEYIYPGSDTPSARIAREALDKLPDEGL